jgi:hypothetical protein
MFKKRVVKGASIRKKEEETHGSADDDSAVNLTDKLLEQSMRKRQKGVTPEMLAKAASHKNDAVVDKGSSAGKIIEGLSQSSNSSQYEKLMEKYVDDKMKVLLPDVALGGDSLSREKFVDSKSVLLNSLLASKDVQESKSQVQEQRFIGLGSGMDEVVLPSSFKAQNMSETGDAASKRRSYGHVTNSKSSAAFAEDGDEFVNPYSAVASGKHSSRFGAGYYNNPGSSSGDGVGPNSSALAVAAASGAHASRAAADLGAAVGSSNVPTVPLPSNLGSNHVDPEIQKNIYVDPTIKAKEAQDRKRKSNEDIVMQNFHRRERNFQMHRR